MAIKLVRTAIRTLRADYDTSAMRDVPMDRIADPEVMADVVTFLCSNEVTVDGTPASEWFDTMCNEKEALKRT